MVTRKVRLYILGAGGHGHVVADAAAAVGEWAQISMLDKSEAVVREATLWQAKHVESTVRPYIRESAQFVIAIGNNATRLRLQSEIRESGGSIATIVHPHASVSPSASLNEGTVVLAGAVVNARAKIGRAGIINVGASVDHDCVLADGVHVSPGAHLAGGVTVGSTSWIGIGAVVRDGIRIGSDAVVGAGAAVVTHMPDSVTVVGVPAKEVIHVAKS